MKCASSGLRLGPSWGALGALLGRLGLSGASLRRPQAVWGHLRAVWGPPWSVLSHLGSLLGLSWAVLWLSWAVFGPSWAVWGRLGSKRRFRDSGFPTGTQVRADQKTMYIGIHGISPAIYGPPAAPAGPVGLRAEEWTVLSNVAQTARPGRLHCDMRAS